LVLGLLGAANRDPDHFTEPDRLDVTREEPRHLAFGSGIHYCLGASLARLEAQVAIGTLLSRFPALSLATERPTWRPSSTLRGLETLPALLGPTRVWGPRRGRRSPLLPGNLSMELEDLATAAGVVRRDRRRGPACGAGRRASIRRHGVCM